MAKYCFPAVFTPEENGGYSVSFPDVEGCFTCGDTLHDAIMMAEDVLPLMLVVLEDEKAPIPTPSRPQDVPHEPQEFVSLIAADTVAYRKKTSNIAVKKTLTIPQWLNVAAEAANVNFSQTLQEALAAKLGLQ